MNHQLNLPAIQAAMTNRGISQTALADTLSVTRAAVSKWFTGKDFPRPRHLLKLGIVLRLKPEDLFTATHEGLEPVVAFRRKGSHRTKIEHIQRAKHMGQLLRTLVPYLPFDKIARPATLKAPANDYDYIQHVARQVRAEIGAAPDGPIAFQPLIGKFKALQAVLIPVLWGNKDHHENALHIYLPDSMTTWIYLNLDSHLHDFNFWMAHELGHVYAPDLQFDAGEDFADSFAQALLFPEPCARLLYEQMRTMRGKGSRVNAIKTVATDYVISPTTIDFALRAHATARDLPSVDVGDAIHAATTNFNKSHPRVSDNLFPGAKPAARQYIGVARELFNSPFFDALRALCADSGVSAGFIENVLQLPLLDAREILKELR